jgi:hypothetical protein
MLKPYQLNGIFDIFTRKYIFLFQYNLTNASELA